jgi:hypothetical protein
MPLTRSEMREISYAAYSTVKVTAREVIPKMMKPDGDWAPVFMLITPDRGLVPVGVEADSRADLTRGLEGIKSLLQEYHAYGFAHVAEVWINDGQEAVLAALMTGDGDEEYMAAIINRRENDHPLLSPWSRIEKLPETMNDFKSLQEVLT